MRIQRAFVVVLVTVFGTLVLTGALEAQALPSEGLARQNLRPYWHVFIAYAIAILLVAGWAGSIAKRLGDVERRLGE
jgi:hypothetical protein